ncbi:Increased DNA methylation 1 [Linum grandiflorum]
MGEVAACVEIITTDGVNEEDEKIGSEIELKSEKEDVEDTPVAKDSEEELLPGKEEQVKEVKDASYEDMTSEVSNPVISPRENVSACLGTISPSTKPLGRSNDGVGLSEGMSHSSGSSSPSETLSEDGEPSSENNNVAACHNSANDSSSPFSTTHVVLEIPKDAISASGIRKITFKFSKRKEDYLSPSAVEPVNYGNVHESSYAEEYGRSPWPDSDLYVTERQDTYSYMPTVETTMSKKLLANYPTNVKKLLATGILDGARARYISFSPERELEGVITGGGYLCGCSFCSFSKVLSAYEFEQHAGVRTRHPNSHIYLDNGKPISSVIQEIKAAQLSEIEEVIRNVVGSSLNEDFFDIWIAGFQQGLEMDEEEAYYKKPSYLLHSDVSCSSQAIDESLWTGYGSYADNSSMGQQPYLATSGKKQSKKRARDNASTSVRKHNSKRRDNDLHRLLFMPNGLPDGAELAYFVKGQEMLSGYKLGSGIFCNCCKREISPSQFEAHAGMAARRQPYRHIYTSNGVSLHDIAIALSNGQNLVTGISDDMCAKCGDGGNLVYCDNCPQAFHQACLEQQFIPEGVWHCPDCKDIGPEENVARTNVIRLKRVVQNPEYDVGGCVVCRSRDFIAGTFDDRTVIFCDQCEREFHVGCLRDRGLCDLKEIPEGKWFCCNECYRVYVALQKSISSGVQTVCSSQLDIICRKHAERGLNIDRANVQWHILMGKERREEDLPFLSKATSIFRECFDPIKARKGRDLIPLMVYGRNISGQEFQGMYCVVLTVKNTVVSAGLLRIFGSEVAELPLVATSRKHQGKGYFQALFSCVEKFLCSLKVESLVLPAAEEAESIWTKRFGFERMTDENWAAYSKEFQLTIFGGTSMLEKKVPQDIE